MESDDIKTFRGLRDHQNTSILYIGKPPFYSHNLYIILSASAVISFLGEWITNSITLALESGKIATYFYISFCRVFLPARRQHGRPARRREHRDGLRRRDRHRHRVGQLVRRTLLQVCSSLRCPNVPLFITDFDANSVCISAAPPCIH